MEIIVNTIVHLYIVFNLILIGGYLLDGFNDDKNFKKFLISVLLLFFGGILVLWELTFAEKFEKWFDKSNFGFYWKLYITRKYDKLDEYTIGYIKKQIIHKKGTKRDMERLTKILNRNGR